MRQLPGDWSGLIVFCAGTSWDGNKFPDQHMAERLTDYAPVLYVDPPVSYLTPLRNPELAASVRGPRVTPLGPRLARLTPLVLPGKGRAGIRATSAALTRRSIRRTVEHLGGAPVRAIVVASLEPLFDAVPAERKVLYATDDFAAGGALMGISETWLRRREAAQLAAADTVVAISPALTDKWRARGLAPVLVANGCDAELFSGADALPAPSDIGLPRPIAGFVGHLSDRIDLGLLEAIADRGRSLLLVGPRQQTFEMARVEALLRKPNVRWVGQKPFASLPAYVGAMDVGLVPYTESEFNRSSFPLKTLEYLAAGRATVATDLPSVRWLESELVTVATGPQAFADAVDAALDAPADAALAARRRALARAHSWEQRAAAFADLLGLRDTAVQDGRGAPAPSRAGLPGGLSS